VIALGAVTAMYSGRFIDRLIGALAAGGVALPPYWLAVIVLAVFAERLGWFPSRGYVSLTRHPIAAIHDLVLPVGVLSALLIPPILRFLRTEVYEMIGSDFVRTARSKGIPERSVALRHVLPNAATPTISFLGIIAGSLLGGVVIIEYIFGLPGLGTLAVNSVTSRDYGVLEGVVLFGAASFIAINILTDLVTLAIDPRLRPGHRR
jgi:peptide/nickel transport system permease protein